ncbi:thiamine diphosphokinase [Fictibacillus sp. Mic-4]|uniref:thiamine diphosphokinase n=1 Tax=Fictibacillus sp. Mic-4 TaxID=3132826 RepID=UPI003CF445E8
MMIYIVAGGPVHRLPDLSQVKQENTVWVGVDRGVWTLLENGITPSCAFGDFDSITRTEKETIEARGITTFVYPDEKNETDLELALNWAFGQTPQEIILLGATGGRLDHELVNVQLLLKGLENGIKMSIVDSQNKIELFAPGDYIIEGDEYFRYISFLAFTNIVEGITLSGFKYPLENATLKKGSTLCISNELVKKNGTYSFSSGILMMIKSRDS